MVVQRITVQIKHGKLGEALEMAKEGRKQWPISGRLYSSIYGTFHTVVFENEAENSAELDKYWEQVNATEEWDPFLAKWNELTVDGLSTNELWRLQDS
jgi:hypothetical protein